MPCNFLQFGDATFSNSRLQLSVILFYNKQVYVLYKIAHSLNEKIGYFVEDKIDDNRCEIYREFDDYQKKKINLILQILYDMMQNN